MTALSALPPGAPSPELVFRRATLRAGVEALVAEVAEPAEAALAPEGEPDEEPEEEAPPEDAPDEALAALEAAPLPVGAEALSTVAAAERRLMTRLGKAFARAHGVLPNLDAQGKRDLAALVEASDRLVRSIASRYANQGVPREDLYQEGMIGLFRAARKFDVGRGFRFSTYAMWWIRQAILQSVHEQGRLIRIPTHAVDQLAKTRRMAQWLEERGLPSGEDAVAAALEMQPRQVVALWRASRRPLSIEGGRAASAEEDETDVGDLLEEPSPGPDEDAQAVDARRVILGALQDLPPRERRIIKLRFGLEDGRVYSLAIVGLEFGLSRERVRQLEATALDILREDYLTRRLLPFLA